MPQVIYACFCQQRNVKKSAVLAIISQIRIKIKETKLHAFGRIVEASYKKVVKEIQGKEEKVKESEVKARSEFQFEIDRLVIKEQVLMLI